LVKNCQKEVKKVDNQGQTALIYAAKNGQAEIIKILLKLEGGIHDKNGMSAYNHAVKNKHTECAKLLQDVPDENSKNNKKPKRDDNDELLEDLHEANKEAEQIVQEQKNKGKGSSIVR
jgi:ankyrin repeat protein